MPFSFGFGNKSVLSDGDKNKIVSDNLVLHLDASKSASYPGSGTTWTDLSGSGNHATLYGATYNSGAGGCIKFDGVDDYADLITNASLKPTQSLTLEAWVYVDSHVASGHSSIIQYPFANTHSSPYFEYGIYTWRGAGQPDYSIHARINGQSSGFSAANAWSLNGWAHVVIAWTAGTVNYYSNGVLLASYGTASSISYENAVNVRLGANKSGGEQFNGKMAQVRVYSQCLSAQQVAQNYNATKSKFNWTPSSLSLVLWLDAADSSKIVKTGNSVTAWNDNSGNARNASVGGAPTYSANGFRGGYPTITTDGVDDVIVSSFGITLSHPFTRIAVFTPLATLASAGGNTAIMHTSFGNRVADYIDLSGNYAQDAGTAAVNTSTATINTPCILVSEMNTASTYAHRNGTSYGPANPGNQSISNICLGRSRYAEGFTNIQYSEVLVISGILSAKDRQKLEGYLAWKWNIQDLLPANHPYKLKRP
jgi:hypothetical protein